MGKDCPYTNYMDRLPLLSSCYVQAAMDYFPFSIRVRIRTGYENRYGLSPLDEGMDVVNVCFKQCKDQFHMYGSPKELLAEIVKYMDFQGNIKVLKMEPSTPYNNQLRFYEVNEDKKKYIFKNDLFLYIQNKLMSKQYQLQGQVTVQMLAYFLQHKEKMLENCVEFVEFGDAEVEYLEKELNQIVKETKSQPGPVENDWKAAFVRMKLLLPSEITKEQMNVTLETLKYMFTDSDEVPRNEAGMFAAVFLHYCRAMFTGIEKIIKDKPQWFNMDSNVKRRKLLPSKPIIRLFLDDHSSFVLSRELAAALKLTSYNEDETDIMDTVSLEMAKSICAAHKTQLTFVKIPIRRAKHRAVPIPSGSGTVCKLAADELLENLRDVIFQYGAFYAPNNVEVGALNKLLRDFERVFDHEIDSIYMLQCGRIKSGSHDANVLELKVAYELLESKLSQKEATQIKNVKGFTLNDLKEEMKRLRLNKFFGDIMDKAEMVFTNTVKNKKAKKLRTCDLYDAVENCVLISFFKKYNKLAQFLHNQKTCHRIHGHQCSWCEDSKKNPEETADLPTTIPLKKHKITFLNELLEIPELLENPEDNVDGNGSTPANEIKNCNETKDVGPTNKQNVENSAKSMDNETKKNEASKKFKDFEFSEAHNDENVPPTSEDVRTSESSNSENSDLKNPNKESKCCPNCFTNSEKCDRANEKLKSFTKKEIEMKKETLALKKELEELKEKEPVMIDILERTYLESLKKADIKLEETKMKDMENKEELKEWERKVEANQKELEAAKIVKNEEEKVKTQLRDAYEQLTEENKRLGKVEGEKDQIMEQLLEELKSLNASE